MSIWNDYINAHDGEKCIITGCGNSINSLNIDEIPDDIIIIGVNDIGRKLTPNYLVVVNNKPSFLEERWNYVENSEASAIFTQFEGFPINNTERIVQLELGGAKKYTFDTPSIIDFHNNSPYVACVIAYYMGFKKIGLIGVDFTQNHFFAPTGIHVLNKEIKDIQDNYDTMYSVFTERGVIFRNLSSESQLTFPKMTLSDFYAL